MADQELGPAQRFSGALKRFAIRVAEIQVRVLLVLFYFSAFVPFALLVRWLDPLALRRRGAPGWSAAARSDHAAHGDDAAHARASRQS